MHPLEKWKREGVCVGGGGGVIGAPTFEQESGTFFSFPTKNALWPTISRQCCL